MRKLKNFKIAINKYKLYNSHSSPINLQLMVFYYYFNLEPPYDVSLEVPAKGEKYNLMPMIV